MSEKEIVLPKGYFRALCSEFSHAKAEVFASSLNPQSIIIIVDDKLVLGPISRLQLEALQHVVGDAWQARRLTPI